MLKRMVPFNSSFKSNNKQQVTHTSPVTCFFTLLLVSEWLFSCSPSFYLHVHIFRFARAWLKPQLWLSFIFFYVPLLLSASLFFSYSCMTVLLLIWNRELKKWTQCMLHCFDISAVFLFYFFMLIWGSLKTPSRIAICLSAHVSVLYIITVQEGYFTLFLKRVSSDLSAIQITRNTGSFPVIVIHNCHL